MTLLLPRSGFVHIFKCGGSSVREALKATGYSVRKEDESGNPLRPFNRRSHGKPSELTPEERQDRFLFTFVREPVAWYRSYWSHRMAHAWTLPQYPEEREAWGDGRPFNKWVRAICDLHPGFLTRLYAEYTAGVDFVGRTEHLLGDLRRALIQAGEQFLPVSIPLANRSRELPPVSDAEKALILDSEHELDY
jgi:hypothetical protein